MKLSSYHRFAFIFLLFAAVRGFATTITVNTYSNGNGFVYDNFPVDGVGDNQDNTGTTLLVGKLDSSSGPDRLQRAIILFNLPSASTFTPGETLVSATLRVYVDGIFNDSGALPAAVLYNAQAYNNTGGFTKTSYEATSYSSTGLNVATSSSATGVYVELDVTSWVMSDYSLDTPSSVVSAFRIQVDGVSSINNNVRDFYRFGRFSGNAPELVLVTTSSIPEPATTTLLFSAIIVCGVVFMRTRRR